MALSKARKIVVGEKVYHWKVSSNGGLHLAVQEVETKKRMVVWYEPVSAITPAIVRREIEGSKPEDWK